MGGVRWGWGGVDGTKEGCSLSLPPNGTWRVPPRPLSACRHARRRRRARSPCPPQVARREVPALQGGWESVDLADGGRTRMVGAGPMTGLR